MKLWKYTFSSILGVSVLTGGIYYATNTESKNEWVKILTDTVSQKTKDTILHLEIQKYIEVYLKISLQLRIRKEKIQSMNYFKIIQFWNKEYNEQAGIEIIYYENWINLFLRNILWTHSQ